MTPMVDLAFLLLTFFMLTTSFSKPKTMPVVMPEEPKEDKPIEINRNDVLNLILAPKDRIFYYYISDNPDVKQASYSSTSDKSIRKILTREQNKNFTERAQSDSSKFKFTVLIKPMDGSRYKNLVDIFDEMNISNIRSYALVDIAKSEIDMVRETETQSTEGAQ